MFADELNASIEAIDKGRGQTLIRDALATGMRPEEVAGYLKDAIAQMLKKYEEGEYFIADLIMMGEVIAGFYQLVRPTDADVIPSGKLVIGTIFGKIFFAVWQEVPGSQWWIWVLMFPLENSSRPSSGRTPIFWGYPLSFPQP